MSIYGDKAAIFLDGENNLRLMKKLNLMSRNIQKFDYSKRDELFKHKWIDNSIWRASFLGKLKKLLRI